MSFTLIPINSGAPVDQFSFPYGVSLAFTDDGGGGNVLLNCLGVGSGTVATAKDLPSFFGSAWRSIPLANAFRALSSAATNTDVEKQLTKNLRVSVFPLSSGATPPAINYITVIPGVPFLEVVGPAVAGTWRVEINYRHSITS